MDPQHFIVGDDHVVTFLTKDGKTFVASLPIAQQMTVIARDLDADITSEVVPLPTVDSHHFEKIVYWCMHHVTNPPVKTEDKKGEHYPVTSEFDKAFFQELLGLDTPAKDQVKILKDFMIPVNYLGKCSCFFLLAFLLKKRLDIKPLLLQCAWYMVHTYIKGKTPDQLRETFQPKPLTEEEQELLKNHPEWDQ